MVGVADEATAGILLVRELGGGGLELGISTACQFGPFLLFGLHAGAIADRTDRFRLTRLLQTTQAIVALLIAIATAVLAAIAIRRLQRRSPDRHRAPARRRCRCGSGPRG